MQIDADKIDSLNKLINIYEFLAFNESMEKKNSFIFVIPGSSLKNATLINKTET
jgi:hypothetical protein